MQNKSMATGAMLLLLGGCGGGGVNELPPPPPAPSPTNTTITDLKASQAFENDAAGMKLDLVTKTGISGQIRPNGLTVNYDATTKSYSVSADGRSDSFLWPRWRGDCSTLFGDCGPRDTGSRDHDPRRRGCEAAVSQRLWPALVLALVAVGSLPAAAETRLDHLSAVDLFQLAERARTEGRSPMRKRFTMHLPKTLTHRCARRPGFARG